MANDMVIHQMGPLLANIVEQATGQAVIAPLNTYEFVSIAQTALKVGYDPILNAISQVLSRTIFSYRPYSRHFGGLEIDATAYGNHIRKIAIADKPADEDLGFKWPVGYDSQQTPPDGDGKSVDMWAIKKPNILQTNFYGTSVFQDHITRFEDQLEIAFRGPDEMQQFFSTVMGEMENKLEQYDESVARSLLANLIGSLIDEGKAERVVHLLTEYNALTGLSLTAQTVYQPDNFAAFMRWVYSRINQISNLFTERSLMYQTVVNGKPVMHHTPKDKQQLYIFSPAMSNTQSMVLSDTYHVNLLKISVNEAVNFWQAIETPDSISVKPVYTNTSGGTKIATNEVEQAGIFGVLLDRDALGYARIHSDVMATPINAAGRYTNIWYNRRLGAYQDNTEKACVFLLD